MALDRTAGPGWMRHAFGDGAQTVLEMLDRAVNDPPGVEPKKTNREYP